MWLSTSQSLAGKSQRQPAWLPVWLPLLLAWPWQGTLQQLAQTDASKHSPVDTRPGPSIFLASVTPLWALLPQEQKAELLLALEGRR